MNLKRLNRMLGRLPNGPNRTIFEQMCRILETNLSSNDGKILDIASNKLPEFSSQIARIFPESEFTHFKDNELLKPRIHRKYSRIPNLKIVYSNRNLQSPYDLAIAFLTLHELRDPKNSLKKAYKRLRENGKIVVIDYELNWFPKLAKQQGWDIQTAKGNFSKYIFTEGNEREVFRDEKDCMQNHTQQGLENYLEYCEKAGFVSLDSRAYNTETPWGEKPKMFLYVGEKVS